MKLTKKTEAEVMEVYEIWLHSYLNGDVKTYDHYFDNEYHFIGSTSNEEFLNRKDTTVFFTKTADQLSGKSDLRNRKRTIELFGELIFITEVFDTYFLMGTEWNYYGRFRFTSILRKNKEGWRFVYQHFSMPDSKAQEGETLGAEKVSKENQELRDAIKRRTIELEHKNRDLEIEAALERVRAVAMGMMKPDDMLHVCKTISQQLIQLGVKEIRNVQTAIFYESKGTYMNYEYYAKHDKTFITDVDFKSHKIQLAFAKKMMKGPNEEVFEQLKGKKLQDWYTYQKSTNQLADKYLLKAQSLNYYWYSLGPVALGISTYYPLTKEETSLFKRFFKVFELAYRRYLDIEKATAQVREAEIEASLERVRSRTMAMHKTSELQEVIHTVHKEVTTLNLSIHGGSFVVINKDIESQLRCWGSGGTANTSEEVVVPHFDMSFCTNLVKGIKKGPDFFTEEFSQSEKKEYFSKLFKLKPWSAISSLEKKETLSSLVGYTRSVVVSKNTTLFVINHNGIKFTESENDILKRFAKVFEQTYTRFLDLQKAESQAREAQIELGLERVRARAMAMQNSNELGVIVDTVFKELTKLNVLLDRCIIMIYDPKNLSSTWWLANPEPASAPVGFFVKYHEHKPYLDYIKAWKDRTLKWEYILEGTDKKEWDEFVFAETELSLLPAPVIAGMKSFDRIFLNVSFNNFGSLTASSVEPLQEEHFDILLRFAKVFDSTYTRFNDLKQAEAQAREAQIQLAMERVRARTMAMQKSDELLDVATVLFQQVKALGVPQWNCGFNIWNIGDKEFTYYPGSPDGKISPSPCNISLTEHPVFMRFDESRKRGDELLIYEKEGEEQADHYRYMLSHPRVGDLLQSMLDAGFELPKFQIDHLANFAYGNLIFITYGHFPEMYDVFKRFAKVFEQTYTRFLDLQKAEAQTREAQINLAVERVRARALAMYKSEEILELVFKLKQEMMELDIPNVVAATIHLKESDGNYTMWDLTSMEYFEGKLHQPMVVHYRLEEVDPDLFIKRMWENTDPYFLVVQDQEDFKRTIQFLRDHGRTKEADESEAFLITAEIKHAYHPTIPLHNGRMCIDLLEPPSPEIEMILTKIGAAFDLAYKRFEDLKNSEKQLREAQIEASLERVRSRSMGMQKSEELKDVIKIVYQQITHLQINCNHAGFVVDYMPKGDWHFWIADDQNIPGKITHPYFDSVWAKQFDEAKEKGANMFATNLNFEEKNKFYHELLSHVPGLPQASKDFYLSCPGLAASTVLLADVGLYIENFSAIPYTDEENNVLMRFGKVFQQTYTRFLDLKKAEAQSREAQIGLGLERVRARTMAMHSSEQLAVVIKTVTDQLQVLGFLFETANFITNFTYKGFNLWLSVPGVEHPSFIYVPYHNNAFFRFLQQGVTLKKEFDSLVASKEEKDNFFNHFFTKSDAGNISDERKKYVFDKPSISFTTAFRKHFYFTVINYEGYLHSSEENIILSRFANVFEQSYTRFLDLQKAEAQAREAQIQLALERVRASAMAMKHSDELREITASVHDQLQSLGFTAGFCSIVIMDRPTGDMKWWMFFPGKEYPESYLFPYVDHPFYLAQLNNWKHGEKYSVMEVSGEEKKSYDKHSFSQTEFVKMPIETQRFMIAFEKITFSNAYMKHGALSWGVEPINEEHSVVLQRFASVFEQCYTRFLDLQKAEAQAKEAQIEAALEKIRGRSLAMNHSDELKDVALVLFKKLDELKVAHKTVAIQLFDFKTKDSIFWPGNILQDEPPKVRLPYNEQMMKEDTCHKDLWDAMSKGEIIFNKVYTKAQKDRWFQYVFANNDTAVIHPHARDFILNAEVHTVCFIPEKNSALFSDSWDGSSFTEEDFNILKRAAKVFEQAYIRFLDLQKAEAQTREAKIETALEKVRSRTMAMQHSDELPVAANLLFLEVQALGIPAWSAGYNIVVEDKKSTTCWMSSEGVLQKPFQLRLWGEASFDEMGDFVRNDNNLLVQELGGKALRKHYAHMKSFPDLKSTFYHIKEQGLSLPTYQINHLCKFTQGFLLFITYEKVPQANDIFKRFTKVFEQTYTRFLDLQKAEAQTRAAKIEGALERVRARALAMQQPEELKEVAEVLRHEMGLLGVEELETCSIYINDVQAEKAECWYALKDIYSTEKKLVNDHFALNLNDTWVGREMLRFYNSPENQTSVLMEGANRKEWINYCEKKSIPFRGYYGEVIPDRTYHLYKFSHGAIGAAAAGDISTESWDLLKRAASVFSLAYSRFKDLTQARTDLIQLKVEKKRAEDALTELQATQTQLIQSEKMASLGELTAGIAHEIQNPLNFVNNFSEVSREMIDELKPFNKLGVSAEKEDVLNDIDANLEKINHHGKRAADIVKGMLQHSRSSNGVKEPTDINALCDEYLRLSYHGLRAKDKSFNATLKTDFDESIGKVNIIPQDIGRVVMNLLTNAFYAVGERLRLRLGGQPDKTDDTHPVETDKNDVTLSPSKGYEPTVSISTKKINNKVEIKVTDNGNGIPPKVVEKIFQPFFTTKPTGQGTGLGLSLSYDIVKAHGGELRVDTQENVGTIFIISLPT